jgi:hypothetical protein
MARSCGAQRIRYAPDRDGRSGGCSCSGGYRVAVRRWPVRPQQRRRVARPAGAPSRAPEASEREPGQMAGSSIRPRGGSSEPVAPAPLIASHPGVKLRSSDRPGVVGRLRAAVPVSGTIRPARQDEGVERACQERAYIDRLVVSPTRHPRTCPGRSGRERRSVVEEEEEEGSGINLIPAPFKPACQRSVTLTIRAFSVPSTCGGLGAA